VAEQGNEAAIVNASALLDPRAKGLIIEEIRSCDPLLLLPPDERTTIRAVAISPSASAEAIDFSVSASNLTGCVIRIESGWAASGWFSEAHAASRSRRRIFHE
jgi:hypothetical protein